MKYLIIGLGNVGPEYASSRHNIGFSILEAIAKQENIKFSQSNMAFSAIMNFKNKQIYLIKPTTFMNLSGKAVSYWIKALKLPLENCLVIVDDLSLPFSTIRLKPKGGAAGHNGLKSIETALNTSNYPRLRFGIGNHFPRGHQAEFVLSPFNKEEQAVLPMLIDRSIKIIYSFAASGLEYAMTQWN